MGRPSKYPEKFRRDALELVRSSGRSIADVARSLGINEGTLSNWVRAERNASERAADPQALTESEGDELRRLRRENIELPATTTSSPTTVATPESHEQIGEPVCVKRGNRRRRWLSKPEKGLGSGRPTR
jgi:transposase